ncbi:DUF563 domain-containing protein [Halorubrum halophilum]|uniref:glycosyltransferase family 61 protein n=1 Tax=Halorubrum halophilum TaxID=413816 RepID=UPI00186B33B8|nr:glycosyltransferase family 61 protein [Halorubrum halophilum]
MSRKQSFGPGSSPYEAVKKLYTDYLRTPLATYLFDRLGYPLLTRQTIYDGRPDYVQYFGEFFPAETVTISEPQSMGPIPTDLQRMVRKWKFVPPFVFVVENADLVGPDALPIAPDSSYIIEAATGSAPRATDALIRTLGSGIAPVHRGTGKRHDTVVSFAGPWSGEFFHWFADYLPRLRVLKRYRKQTGVTPKILLPPDPPEWMTRSLTLLDVPESRRLQWDGGRWSVDHLVVPSLPRHTRSTVPDVGYIHSPRELRWVTESLLSKLPPTASPDVGNRLYVSRSRQPSRHVRNEAELLSVAHEFGFDAVYPEDWSLDEQLAVFAEADVVLGPHGAGLLNAMYGDETTLVELFGKRTNPCFFAIAEGMDMSYAMLQCEAVGDDMRVDPEQLRELLALAVSD